MTGNWQVAAKAAESDGGTSIEAIRFGLRRTATARERVNALLGYGLSLEDLRDAVQVSENTIRNWGRGQSAPRRAAEFALDNLRETALALIDLGLDRRRGRNWLRSRDREAFNGQRPIDVLRRDPLAVFAAVEQLELESAHEPDPRPELRVVN